MYCFVVTEMPLEALKISGLWSGWMSIIHLQQHNVQADAVFPRRGKLYMHLDATLDLENSFQQCLCSTKVK